MPSRDVSRDANEIITLAKPHINNASVIINPETGGIHQTSGNDGYGKRLGYLGVGDTTTRNVSPTELYKIIPPTGNDVSPSMLGLHVNLDGSLSRGVEYLKREKAMENEGLIPKTAAEIDVADVVDHLRVIKLWPELLGTASLNFHVAKGFKTAPAPFLDFRISLKDQYVGGVYRSGPLTDPQRSQSTFYEAFVSCRKDRETIGYPVETRMRANQFDPLDADRENAAFSAGLKRNHACISELERIGNRVGPDGEPTTNETLPSMEERRASGHSENNILADLHTILQKHVRRHRNEPTTWFINPIQLLAITQSDFSKPGGVYGRTPVSMPLGGSIEMPTIPGVRLILDIRLPQDKLFAADPKTLLWLIEGPKKMEYIDDKFKQANYIDYTDWYDTHCIHPDIEDDTTRRFGYTVHFHADDVN